MLKKPDTVQFCVEDYSISGHFDKRIKQRWAFTNPPVGLVLNPFVSNPELEDWD